MPNVGFMMRNQLGIDFSGTNTAREGPRASAHGTRATSTRWISTWICRSSIRQSFSFSPAIADGTLLGYQMCDWIDNAIALQMSRSEGQVYGYMRLPCRVEVNARLARPRRAGEEDWLSSPASA